MYGKVTLVGAGPGDPGLLTLKGREALEAAQVVVYDRLVSPAVLALAPEEAERIDVGKRSAHHPVPQERISQILLEKAAEGRRVVRLKGGDPFLFGRGGEELELLEAHGVPFEEVPGITSAIAVPAYAGIPVTHRDMTSSLHIITGHARQGRSWTSTSRPWSAPRAPWCSSWGSPACPGSVPGSWRRGWTRRPPPPWWSGAPCPRSGR